MVFVAACNRKLNFEWFKQAGYFIIPQNASSKGTWLQDWFILTVGETTKAQFFPALSSLACLLYP